MSKGDKQRPLSVSKKEYDERFEDIFEPVPYGDKEAKDFMHEQPKEFSWGKAKRVLSKVMNNPIMDFVITIIPNPFKNMLKWLKERLKEPSTYQGITVIASAIGFSVSPELWSAIVTTASGIIGVIQVMKKENKKDKEE